MKRAGRTTVGYAHRDVRIYRHDLDILETDNSPSCNISQAEGALDRDLDPDQRLSTTKLHSVHHEDARVALSTL